VGQPRSVPELGQGALYRDGGTTIARRWMMTTRLRVSGAFSLGMGQPLGIAAALLGDPDVVILDEPVNGLDPEGILWIRGLLRSLADEGRTVFSSSHLISEIALVADHLIVIGRGELIADTSVSELQRAASGVVVEVRTPRPDDLARLLLDDRRRRGRRMDGCVPWSPRGAAADPCLTSRRGGQDESVGAR
jgi:ABC-type multidrug transport system ATPase subunit